MNPNQIQPRSVTVTAVHNGYVVQVGCATFVFTDREALLAELRSYLMNPMAVEADYRVKYPSLVPDGSLERLQAVTMGAYSSPGPSVPPPAPY